MQAKCTHADTRTQAHTCMQTQSNINVPCRPTAFDRIQIYVQINKILSNRCRWSSRSDSFSPSTCHRIRWVVGIRAPITQRSRTPCLSLFFFSNKPSRSSTPAAQPMRTPLCTLGTAHTRKYSHIAYATQSHARSPIHLICAHNLAEYLARRLSGNQLPFAAPSITISRVFLAVRALINYMYTLDVFFVCFHVLFFNQFMMRCRIACVRLHRQSLIAMNETNW